VTVPSVPAWIQKHARARPAAPAVDGPELRLSYAALAGATAALAGDLRAAGFGRGSRLVVALPHAPAAVVALAAAQMAGGSAVPLARDADADTVRKVLAQTGARHAVVSAGDAPRWAGLGAAAIDRWWILREGGAAAGPHGAVPLRDDGAPARPAAPLAQPAAVEPGDEALVLFTSGSTGEPRGVVQTHRNVAANTRSIVAYLGLGPEDRALAILPLFYCYGLSVLQTHLHAGGSVHLEPRSMYPQVLLDALDREGCTGFAGVPLTFELLRRSVDVASARRSRLRYVTQAGGAMSPDTAAWARRSFRPAALFVMYGQTEATSRLAYLPPDVAERKAGSIGIPIPGVELRVLGQNGRELAPGEVGELVARGENVTAGYLGAPEETAATFRPDGLHTGDLAYRDEDGFLFLVGRAKEMLKLGGHRVSPIQIERVLAEHPAVSEAAVVGVPDAVQGEAAEAFVVVRVGSAASQRELQVLCRRRLPAHCVPRAVRFVPALPHSAAGKLLRQELARFARGHDGGRGQER
jgi:long-chain acyl-CoA synthetase